MGRGNGMMRVPEGFVCRGKQGVSLPHHELRVRLQTLGSSVTASFVFCLIALAVLLTMYEVVQLEDERSD